MESLVLHVAPIPREDLPSIWASRGKMAPAMVAEMPGAPAETLPQEKRPGWWRKLLRSPAAELFEFEAERGRIRLEGLNPWARWLATLGLATTGLLVVAVLVPGIFLHGRSGTLGAGRGTLTVDSAVAAVTLVLFGIAWELVVYGALMSSWPVRVVVGILFLLVNGVIVGSFPSALASQPIVTASWDLARVTVVAAPAALILSSVVPDQLRVGPLSAQVLLGWLTGSASCLFFASLLLAEGLGRSSPQEQIELTGGVVLALGTVILLLAPLLYLSGMAVLSVSYTIGTAATEVARRLGQRTLLALVVVLLVAETWFYGLHDRAGLVPAHRGWVVLLHVVPVLIGFAGIVYTGRKALGARGEPVHDNASLAVAVLVALVSIAGGLYFALYNLSTLGFLHIPPAVTRGLGSSDSAFVTAIDSTGARCVLFGTVTALAVAVAHHEGVTLRRRQFAVGLALMSGWAFWTLFVDWLPGTDTADESLLALLSLGLVAIYLVTRYLRAGHRARPQELTVVVGVLVVVWIFDADGAFLRSLSHLVPFEGGIVVVVGVLLVLLGKSQFAAGASAAFPRAARLLIWIGYIVASLTVVYWDRGVIGFADFSAHNGEISVFHFVAVPYIAWLLVSGRFSTRLVGTRQEEGSAAPPVPEVVPAKARQEAAALAVCTAALLCGCAWGAYAIDTSGTARPVPIAHGVGVDVAPHWVLVRRASLAVATRTAPSAVFMVLVGTSAAHDPLKELSRFLAGESFLHDVVTHDQTTLPLGQQGNFSAVGLARFDALYSGRRVTGQLYALVNPSTEVTAFGAAFVTSGRDYSAVGTQVASMELSLDAHLSPGLW